MLRLPPFELRRPSSAAEAVEILAAEGTAARAVAGGTDLWPNMKRRHQQANVVVDLMAISGLAGITNGDATRELSLGATTTLADVERSEEVRGRYPALARAVASISSPPLRNMGTIGGNVCVDTRCTYYNQTEGWRKSIDYCMKEVGPKAESQVCWVAPSSPRCWAHSATDAAPMLSALGARVVLLRTEGERAVPIDALYRDDGIEYLTKRPDELVTQVLLPPESNADRCRSAFWKLRRRGSIDFAVLSVAVAVWPSSRREASETLAGPIERAKIVLGAVGSRPIVVEAAAQALAGQPLDDSAASADAVAQAAAKARKAATPMDNTDFQTQWRGQMVERYVTAALREAAGLDPGIRAPRHRLL